MFNQIELHQEYTTPYGSVYFNRVAKHSVVRLSGGFDSAVMLYLLAKTVSEYRDDALIDPFTVQRSNPVGIDKYERVHIVPYAERIIEYVRERFPSVEIADTLVEPANYWWVHEFVNGANISSYGTAQETVGAFTRWRHENHRMKKHETPENNYLIEYNGVTRNPPLHCVEQSDEQHRDLLDSRTLFPDSATVCHDSMTNWQYQYMPWRNADKRVVFWLAQEHGILDDMLNLTRSCEGDQWNTENFTKECGECWWCLEREWAKNNFTNTEIVHD